jgi:hypothetical protein
MLDKRGINGPETPLLDPAEKSLLRSTRLADFQNISQTRRPCRYADPKRSEHMIVGYSIRVQDCITVLVPLVALSSRQHVTRC